jgi:hypothetical protein
VEDGNAETLKPDVGSRGAIVRLIVVDGVAESVSFSLGYASEQSRTLRFPLQIQHAFRPCFAR